jgi:hypothetical protein
VLAKKISNVRNAAETVLTVEPAEMKKSIRIREPHLKAEYS